MQSLVRLYSVQTVYNIKLVEIVGRTGPVTIHMWLVRSSDQHHQFILRPLLPDDDEEEEVKRERPQMKTRILQPVGMRDHRHDVIE